MIRTDKMHQWASTQMAAHEPEPHKWPLEEGRKRTGLDYQGRYPEDEHPPHPWDDRSMTFIEIVMWWWPAISPALGLVMLGLAAVYWSEIAAFLGVA